MFLRLKSSLVVTITSLLALTSSTSASTTCAPANLTSTGYAAPSLEYDFHMNVGLNPTISVGAATWGTRNWISFSGGSFCSTWLNGTTGSVAPSGQDANVAPLNKTIANGTWLDTNYLLTTDDEVPAHMLIRTSGWSTSSPSLWRLYIKIETGDERYYFLNTRMWVGALTSLETTDGLKTIEYDAYRIL